jgi:hypothetical protein
MTLEERIDRIERTLGIEDFVSLGDAVDVTLRLPKGRFGGLSFNELTVNACFEKGADGVYYSDRVLFMSAKSADDDDGFDHLSDYINQTLIAKQIGQAFGVPASSVYVKLPNERRGKLTYNGAPCAYWLAGRSKLFFGVDVNGIGCNVPSTRVLGCAPVVHIAR